MRYHDQVNVLRNLLEQTREDSHDVVVNCFLELQDAHDEDILKEILETAKGVSELTDGCLNEALEFLSD